MFVSSIGSWKRKISERKKKRWNTNQASSWIHSILVYLHVNFCCGKWGMSYEVLDLGKLRRVSTQGCYALSLQLFWISEITSKQTTRAIYNCVSLSGAVVDSLAGLQFVAASQDHPTETFVVILSQDPYSWHPACCWDPFCPGTA